MVVAVDKCCFCFELKRACYIIGYLGLFMYGSITLYSLKLMVAPGECDNPDKLSYDIRNPEHVDTNCDPDSFPSIWSLLVVFAVYLAAFIVHLAFVYGIHEKIPKYVKYWCFYKLVLVAFSAILVLVAFFSSSVGFADVSSKIVMMLWDVYIWVVVKNYLAEMESETNNADMPLDINQSNMKTMLP